MSVPHPDAGDVSLDVLELVGTATHELLNGVTDWSTNLQIVDAINAKPAHGKPVMELLKKKIAHKKHQVGLVAVTLLETLVKNCPSFRQEITSVEFLEFYIKVLPKQVREPNSKSLFSFTDKAQDILAMERWDRMLLVLQSWAIAFQKDKNRGPLFTAFYEELRKKGVKFPQPERDELAPVDTPPVAERKEDVVAKAAVQSPLPPTQSLAQHQVAAATATSSSSSRAAAVAAAQNRAGRTTTAASVSASASQSPQQRAPLHAAAPAPAPAAAAAAAAALRGPTIPPRSSFTDARCLEAHETVTLLLDLLQQSTLERAALAQDELISQVAMQVGQQTEANRTRLSSLVANMSPNSDVLVGQVFLANDMLNDTLNYFNDLIAGKIHKQNVAAPAPVSVPAPVAAAPRASPSSSQPIQAHANVLDFFSNPAPPAPSNHQQQPQRNPAAFGVVPAPLPVSAQSSASASSIPLIAPPPSSATQSRPAPASIPRLAPPPGSGDAEGGPKRSRAASRTVESAPAPVGAAPPVVSAPSNVPANDLLDLFSSAAPPAPSSVSAASRPSNHGAPSANPLDFFGAPSSSSSSSNKAATPFDDNFEANFSAAPPASSSAAAAPPADDDPFLALATRSSVSSSSSKQQNSLDAFANLSFQ